MRKMYFSELSRRLREKGIETSLADTQKLDNIVQFFSNNPKSQKSLWLAKKDCVNAVLDEDDNLDYTIDDTTGICDLTIYFDGNARNLEVMISRVSSK